MGSSQIELFTPIRVPDVPYDSNLDGDFQISARTAIGRTKVSAPLQILLDKALFNTGSVMHYGKGRTTLDSQALADHGLKVFDYDYVHCPNPDVLGSTYDNVYCGYVVNTLPPEARAHVYRQLAHLSSGTVFIAARSDKIKGDRSEDGVRTSIGTFQKSYKKDELLLEAQAYFMHVTEIPSKSGMTIVACTN